MRRILSTFAVTALIVGCGGGGGGDGGGNGVPATPPTLTGALLSADGTTFDGGDITIDQGAEATLYVQFDWADPNGDLEMAHVSYVTLQRELEVPVTIGQGETSGREVVSFTVPATDGAGVSSVDFWLEDSRGQASAKTRLRYTTRQPFSITGNLTDDLYLYDVGGGNVLGIGYEPSIGHVVAVVDGAPGWLPMGFNGPATSDLQFSVTSETIDGNGNGFEDETLYPAAGSGAFADDGSAITTTFTVHVISDFTFTFTGSFITSRPKTGSVQATMRAFMATR